ncbi:MAG: hypothetical protein KAH30_02725 [Caldisericia bacterium]|nr:hypothetical protein [Caldisericia bacterium]
MLKQIYYKLLEHFGRQNWWPGDTPWEVVVGAILTQQVSWKNVEKAISNLKNEDILEPEKLVSADIELVKTCIRPSVYFNQKTIKILNMANYVLKNHGLIEKMLSRPTLVVREELLEIKGIGPETADSILCYAGNHPIFVVDAYTKRLAKCIGLSETEDYHKIQKIFMDELKGDNQLYNEFHALILRLGKIYCKKKNPLCGECPVERLNL